MTHTIKIAFEKYKADVNNLADYETFSAGYLASIEAIITTKPTAYMIVTGHGTHFSVPKPKSFIPWTPLYTFGTKARDGGFA